MSAILTVIVSIFFLLSVISSRTLAVSIFHSQTASFSTSTSIVMLSPTPQSEVIGFTFVGANKSSGDISFVELVEQGISGQYGAVIATTYCIDFEFRTTRSNGFLFARRPVAPGIKRCQRSGREHPARSSMDNDDESDCVDGGRQTKEETTTLAGVDGEPPKPETEPKRRVERPVACHQHQLMASIRIGMMYVSVTICDGQSSATGISVGRGKV